MELEKNLSLDQNMRVGKTIVLEQVEPGSTVLEFGPNTGVMTKYMKETLGCRVYAVEIDRDASENCRQYTERIITANIEHPEAWYPQLSDLIFDYILFVDVLEHLVNPRDALIKATGLLKESGRILISIPNISHNGVIAGLINNRFNYKSFGILDYTHMRFFTKESCLKLVSESGLFLWNMDCAYWPVGDDMTGGDNFFLPQSVRQFLMARSEGEVVQYVLDVRKSPPNDMRLPQSNGQVQQIITSELFWRTSENIDFLTDQCITKLVITDSEDYDVTFELPEKETLDSIRWDPSFDPCACWDIQIEINSAPYYDWQIQYIDNYIDSEGTYLFPCLDPKFIIQLNFVAPVKSIRLRCRFQSLTPLEALSILLPKHLSLQSSCQNYVAQNEVLKKEYENCTTFIENLQQKYDQIISQYMHSQELVIQFNDVYRVLSNEYINLQKSYLALEGINRHEHQAYDDLVNSYLALEEVNRHEHQAYDDLVKRLRQAERELEDKTLQNASLSEDLAYKTKLLDKLNRHISINNQKWVVRLVHKLFTSPISLEDYVDDEGEQKD